MSEEQSPLISVYKGHEEEELKDVTGLSPVTATRIIRRKKWIPVTICLVVVLVAVLVVSGLCIGLFAVPGRHSAGGSADDGNITQEICANPPVLLVSMDGFRADYLERHMTPNLQSLIDSGVRAAYMRSSFPTLTFPNHYSIVTGLYPESHGMVNNAFYDTKLKQKFYVGSENANDGKWWGGEPVWVTAVKNKLIAGVYYWPGSEAEIKGIRPNYYFRYKDVTPFNVRVDTVLGWLDLSKDKRPQFLAMYFNEPDHTGHVYGPDSPELNTVLGVVDQAIGRLFKGLQDRNISDCVNIMLVSDHGMSPTNYSKIVNASQLLPSDLISSGNLSFPSRGPVMNIGVRGGNDTVDEVYQSIVKNGTDMGNPFRVFLTENLPLRMHTGHSNKQRYGAVYMIADDHAYLIPPFPSTRGPPAGNHGYDNIERTMRATFIAHGPAFKQKYVAPPIENIQLYSLMCELLNITAAPNNGTVGSLRHILAPQVAKRFSPPKASGGSPGVEDTCPFPGDNNTLVLRSVCDVCVCSCNVSKATILASNRDSFNHTDAQETQYQQQHFPWGVPLGGRGSGACLLSQPDYVHIYSNSLRIPLLVGYTLTGEVLNSTSEVCFRRDPRLAPTNSANCSLYNATSEDLVLWNSDMLTGDLEDDSLGLSPVSWVLLTNTSVGDGLSTSVLSARVPLRWAFITNVWFPVLHALSDWLRTYHMLHIIVGSVMDADRNGLRDPDSAYPRVEGVAVPSHVFVVVTRCGDGGALESCDAGDLEVLGMLFRHPLETGDYSDSDRVLRYALTPLRDIERVTGFDFFPNLSAEQQNLLELRLLDELWPRHLTSEEILAENSF